MNCPKCGTVMCEKFDEREGPNGILLVTPNGKFSCMKCGYDPDKVVTRERQEENAQQ